MPQQKFNLSQSHADINKEFELSLKELAQPANNNNKLFVVCSALIEASPEVTPEDIFVAGIATLEGTILSSTSSDMTTQLALMKILDLSILNIANKTLYNQNFPLLSRVLRAISSVTVSGAASHQGEEGFSTTVRHMITLSKTSIIAINAQEENKKHLLKLLQDCILAYFDHSSPKIRKTAQLCAMELLSCANNDVAAVHICQYTHAVLTAATTQSIFPNNDSQLVRIFHMLYFVRQASGLLLLKIQPSIEKTNINSNSIHQDLIQLFVVVTKFVTDNPIVSSAAATKHNNAVKNKVIQLISSIFQCLIAIIEYDPNAVADMHTAALRCTQKEISSQVLASLLHKAQFIISLLKSSTEDASSSVCRVVFAQLIVTCTCAVLYKEEEEEDDPLEQKYLLLAQKLYPLSLQTVVHCCSGGNSDAEDDAVYRCSIELQRLNRLFLSSDIIRSSEPILVSSVESMKLLLNFKYRDHWNHLLQAYSHFVVQMVLNSNKDSTTTPLASSMIDRIVELHLAKQANDPGSIPIIENAVGTIIEGFGIEKFLLLCSPLDKSSGASNISQSTRGLRLARLWILNLLKTRGAKYYAEEPTYHLAFFQSHILGLARKCDAAAASDVSQQQKQACIDLWSLLAIFCTNPVDIQDSLPIFVPTILRAIQDVRYHPQLITILCNSLKILASGASQRKEIQSVKESSHFSVLQGDIMVISEESVKLLPTLFKMVEHLTATRPDKSTSMGEDGDKKVSSSLEQQEKMRCATFLTDAIAALASLAPPEFLQSLFKKVMHRLILAIQDQNDSRSSRVDAYLRLAQALVSSKSLDGSSVDLLYRAIKPLIRSDEQCLKTQKSAYKVMAEICDSYPKFVNSSEKMVEISELLIGSIMTCHISARQMRLKCLNSMIKNFDRENAQHMDLMVQMTGEVFLCLKDSNGKARDLAYEILLSMARVFHDMNAFFPVVLGALAAKTAHMRSAAVMALSRLVFEYARHDEAVQALLPSLLQTVVVLFDEKARELIKSVVGFVRISIAAMSREQLEPILSEVVAGLFKFGRGKDRFRAKIKIILKKLVRLFGYEKITPFVPESDTRLLTHMRKLAERAARRKAESKQQSNADESNVEFQAMMESDEEDSDDGLTLMTGKTGFTKLTAMTGKTVRSSATSFNKSVAESAGVSSVGGKSTKSTKRSRRDNETGPRVVNAEKDGEVLDMLDNTRMMKQVRFEDILADDDDDVSDDGMMEFDSNGKLVVQDAALLIEGGRPDISMDDEEADDAENEEINSGKRRRVSKFENVKEAKAKTHAKKNEEQRQKNQNKNALGTAYKAKKAGGDVKKKGQQFEPYAYIPLDRKNYTKKFRGKAVSQMESVVKNVGSKRKRKAL